MTDIHENLTENGKRDAREVIHKFIQTNRLHRRVIEHWADRIDMHCSAHRMLMHVSCEKNVMSQKELAEHLKISPAAVATTLKKLETDGYIERSKCKSCSDSRTNEITVTERGRKAAEDTEKYFRFVDSSALNGFSDEEIETLLRLLDKMQNNLHEIENISDLK